MSDVRFSPFRPPVRPLVAVIGLAVAAGPAPSSACDGCAPRDAVSLPVNTDDIPYLKVGQTVDVMAVKRIGTTLQLVPLWKEMTVVGFERGVGVHEDGRPTRPGTVDVCVDQEQALIWSLSRKLGLEFRVLPSSQANVGFNDNLDLKRTRRMLEQMHRDGRETAPPPRSKATE